MKAPLGIGGVFGSCFAKEPTELEMNTQKNGRATDRKSLIESIQCERGDLCSSNSMSRVWCDKGNVPLSASTLRKRGRKYSSEVRWASEVEGAEFSSRGVLSYFKKPDTATSSQVSAQPTSGGLV
mmetsp:Transcript_17299/g.37599  ORF Transcript_17299/g.37599 Transcript_17299/m.37599 type:complete len:125 (-) Transcript_17299:647-1021(-)